MGIYTYSQKNMVTTNQPHNAFMPWQCWFDRIKPKSISKLLQ